MLTITTRELKPNGLCRVQSVIILAVRDDFAWLGQCGSSGGTGKCRERRDRAAAPPDRSGGRMRGFTRRAVNSLQSHSTLALAARWRADGHAAGNDV